MNLYSTGITTKHNMQLKTIMFIFCFLVILTSNYAYAVPNISVTMNSGQTQNPYALKDSASSNVFYIDPSGRIFLAEATAPSTPSANSVIIYAKDNSGVSGLFYKNDAGTETSLNSLAYTNTNNVFSNSQQITRSDDSNANFGATSISDTAISNYVISRARAGTTVVQSGDNLGQVIIQGYDGTTYVAGVIIRGVAEETFSATARGSSFKIFTVPKTTTTATEVMRFLDNGNVGIVSGKKIFLDGVAGTGDTYITESSANVLQLVKGGNVIPFTEYLTSDVTCTATGTYCTVFTIPLTASSGNTITGILSADSNTAGGAVQVRGRTDDAGAIGWCKFVTPLTATTEALDYFVVGTAPTDTGETTWLPSANEPQPIHFTCSVEADATATQNLIIEIQQEVASTGTIQKGSHYIKTP